MQNEVHQIPNHLDKILARTSTKVLLNARAFKIMNIEHFISLKNILYSSIYEDLKILLFFLLG